jgi:DNA-directed RNA polymerase subunit RPC12/RpoP
VGLNNTLCVFFCLFQKKGISSMSVKYYCSKCDKRFIEWGAEKMDFKCPDCVDEALLKVGMQQDKPGKKPTLKRKKAAKKAPKKAAKKAVAKESATAGDAKDTAKPLAKAKSKKKAADKA